MASVEPNKAGVGSAVLNSSRQVGGSIGIALMGAIVASRSASALRAGEATPNAFVHGLQGALEIAAVIVFAGALIALATIRKPERSEPAVAEYAEAA
jgi:energy-converting hydrogenase Eha subunit B